MSETNTNLLSYLRQNPSLKSETFNQLANDYGFDSSDTLSAIRTDRDLPAMTAINLGQRALLRQSINEYMTLNELDNSLRNTKDDNKVDNRSEERSCDESHCQSRQLIRKLNALLSADSDKHLSQMKAENKRLRQAMIRCRNLQIKTENESKAKDRDIKRLEAEVFRLKKYHLHSGGTNRRFESALKHKDLIIKRLETNVQQLNLKISSMTAEFDGFADKCFTDMTKIKTYLDNECMTIHANSCSIAPAVLPLNKKPEVDKQSDVCPPRLECELMSNIASKVKVDKDKLRTQTVEFNQLADSHQKLVLPPKLESESLLKESRMIKKSKVNYFNHKSSNDTNNAFINNNIICNKLNTNNEDLNESIISNEDKEVEPKPYDRPKRSRVKNTIPLNCEQSVNSPRNRHKKLKTTEEPIKTCPASDKVIILSLDSESDNNTCIEGQLPDSVVPDSVTYVTITGTAVERSTKVDINMDNDTDSEEQTSNRYTKLCLKQNVDSSDSCIMISTSAGYLSDSNQENRCSIVNTLVNGIASAGTSTTVSCAAPTTASNQSSHQKKGFKCQQPDCDFATLFAPKFEDHIKKHVSYHFGQEIPEFWRPYFNEFQKTLSNCKK